MGSSKALVLVLLLAVALLAVAGAGEAGTAGQRLEDSAEWELPVDMELHRRMGAAGGDLSYINVIVRGALMPDRPACVGTCPANGRGGHEGRGCHKVSGCVGGRG